MKSVTFSKCVQRMTNLTSIKRWASNTLKPAQIVWYGAVWGFFFFFFFLKRLYSQASNADMHVCFQSVGTYFLPWFGDSGAGIG